jgi:hypothetical protein
MRASLSIHELRTHSHPVAALLLAPLQHIAHPEISADLFYVSSLALISEGGAAGDHKAMANTRETSGQLLGEDIGEIILGCKASAASTASAHAIDGRMMTLAVFAVSLMARLVNLHSGRCKRL